MGNASGDARIGGACGLLETVVPNLWVVQLGRAGKGIVAVLREDREWWEAPVEMRLPC